MTTKQELLRNRGFITDITEASLYAISFEKKTALLQHKKAIKRTLGARLLKNNKTKETVKYLIEALHIEKKLYSKIEICSTLSLMNSIAVKPLINCLGVIGSNQHKVVPEKEFLKDSYPLPRDIASRTLIRIGERAIPELLNELKSEDTVVLSELIDTIGHINFNTKIKEIYKPLKLCYIKNKTNDLIKWKIIRACSGIAESEGFLKELETEIDTKRLQKEIQRSLRLVRKRNTKT